MGRCSSVQTLATAIGAGACPATITLTNSIDPVPGYESNVAAFGLIQIDGEQFSYFGRSLAANPTPANTLYDVQCAQNGTARAAHSSLATVVPLNNFKPNYPWPVTPTLNANDTTPSGTAGYFPGWNVGNAAFAFPVATGISTSSGASGAWSANSRIENLSFYQWPNEINGEQWSSVNHTAMLYEVSPSYASVFSNLYALYLFYGIALGPPSIENGNYASAQPTGDGTHWDGVTIYAANPVNIPLGNQNTFSNFNVYSSEGTTNGVGVGADTCYYFTALYNDQTGGVFDVLSLDHFKNLYCENEGGAHDVQMPIWEWDTYNSEIEDQHMGGGGEVWIGGGQQHWLGGNFNNAINTPVINWGTGNTSDYVTGMGSEPKGNVYGANSLINWAPFTNFSGLTSQRFSTATGPYGGLAVGNSRRPIPNQTAETFFTGNLTQPYTSLDGGFITPEEFNASFAFESQAMSVGWTYDSTSPVTNAYVGCNVGNNPGSIYCATGQFNTETMPIGPGQRLVPGKYTMYLSMKDAATATNTETLSIFSNCGGFSNSFNIPITNAWPLTAAGVFTAPIDFTPVTGSGCSLGVRFWGATTADQIQVGYLDFAPVAEQLNATTINTTTINLPPGTTGGSATGCAQSPVTGIDGGYTCPTKGWSSAITGNEGATDTSVPIASVTGLSAAGCFFVDGEYECYTGISGNTLTGLTRGAYLTTPATHSSGAAAISINLVLGSIQQVPSDVIAYGGSEAPILGINDPTPFSHGGASVLSINSGANETWVDTAGAIHQLNVGAQSQIQGSLMVGTLDNQPDLAATGYLLQTNGPNTAYAPLTLGAGHAGTLNVVKTPTIAAARLIIGVPTGTSTVSYVCAGTDFDGNLIDGTTTTVTTSAASWSFPQAYGVMCPWSAGVNTYQVYRTVGGVNQGLLGSGVGPGYVFTDFDGSATAGTPPGVNGSNPRITVAGTGTPTITLGSTQILAAAGAPPAGCGSSYGNGSVYLRTDGSVAAADLMFVCDASTSAWVDVK
jgi:hypothetical protein